MLCWGWRCSLSEGFLEGRAHSCGVVGECRADFDVYPATAGCSGDRLAVVDLPGGAIATPCAAPRFRPVVGDHFDAKQVCVVDQPCDNRLDVFACGVADVHRAAGLMDGWLAGFASSVTLRVGAQVREFAGVQEQDQVAQRDSAREWAAAVRVVAGIWPNQLQPILGLFHSMSSYCRPMDEAQVAPISKFPRPKSTTKTVWVG